jgi:hypothetical protein
MGKKDKAREEYLREQSKGHAARQRRMREKGKPWHPTNKRQWNTES